MRNKQEWIAILVNADKKAKSFFKGDKKNIQSAKTLDDLALIASAIKVDEEWNKEFVQQLLEEKQRMKKESDVRFLTAVRESGVRLYFCRWIAHKLD